MLDYCYTLGIKIITMYGFSIDNLKRPSDEVALLMDLIRIKMEEFIEEDSIVHKHQTRMYIVGNLDLLEASVRLAAERAMAATAHYSNTVFIICIAYTSTDEILHGVRDSCKSQLGGGVDGSTSRTTVQLADIEKRMFMSVAPDPDLVIRSSGESRLSNFLLWQTGSTLLHSIDTLWPEIGPRHVLRAIIDYQRSHSYLVKKSKQA